MENVEPEAKASSEIASNVTAAELAEVYEIPVALEEPKATAAGAKTPTQDTDKNSII